MAYCKQSAGHEEVLKCPVCLEIYKDPVIVECGHSFCRECIDIFWDYNKNISCPECCEKFSARKHKVNQLLASVIRGTQRMSQRKKQEKPDSSQKEGTQIPTAKQEKVLQHCDEHGMNLELFCEEDETLACAQCVPKHYGHHFISLQEAVSMYQDKLKVASRCLECRLKVLAELQKKQIQKVSSIKGQAQSLEQHITSEFVRLHQFLQDKEQQLIQQLKREAAGILEETEENLKIIKEKSNTIQRQILAIQSKINQDDSLRLLMEFKDDVERFAKLSDETTLSKSIFVTHSLNLGMYKNPLLQYSIWKEMESIISPALSPVTVDPKTAHSNIIVSKDRTSIRCANKERQLPDNADRFDYQPFVLGSEGFTSGKHCWKVETKNMTNWMLGVAQESCKRKGNFNINPKNGFWTLLLLSGDNMSCQMGSRQKINHVTGRHGRVLVYLDYDEGQLSFYNADYGSHIYTFVSPFSARLYPVFSPRDRNVEPLKLMHEKQN
ncbi:zinc-binding protein A33-like [Protopterus annectens]|uniref:zinc-binding protein A33-like n=1 Tax=Protopterus annectens TaxID=7888 RepID=UPI001CF9B938|nr:zinc-binding protein A33-like [Protopterus annectens]